MAESYKDITKKRAKLEKEQISKRNGGPMMKLLLFIASCSLIVYCIASIITTGADNAQKQLELDKLSADISSLENQNEELNAILNECDEKTYMENIAMELLGYAYPNERRFYNTSRN